MYLAIAAGWLIARKGLFDESFPAMGTKVVVNLLYPCLMLRLVLGNEALHEPENLLLPPLLGFCTVSTIMVLAAFVARWRKLGDNALRRTFAFITGINNYGYVPIPLCMALFDLRTAGVLMVFNLGTELAVWLLGPLILSGRKFQASNLRALLNPVLIALGAGIFLNLLDATAHLPSVARHTLETTLKLLGDAAIPLALVLIGGTMHHLLRRLGFERDWAVMGWGIFLRQLLAPVMLLSLMWLLPATIELKRVLVLQAAMPCGVFSILMSVHYGGRPMTAVQLVLSTSFVGLLLTPMWLLVGMKLISLSS